MPDMIRSFGYHKFFCRVMTVLLLCLVAAACASSEEEAYVELPVAALYNDASDALESRKFGGAAALYEEVERQHPYSVWATKAQIMAAYARYQGNDYDAAIAALDRFIHLHPAHRDVPYAYYLKGLSYYEQIVDVSRDQEMTLLAQSNLHMLITRYPLSIYASDAKVKIDLTNDHLAGMEMNIGRYYLRQGHYLAAINRFKRVVGTYGTTSHVPESLHRLTEAYLALGLREESKKTAAVLGYNFSDSEWYVDSYELVENRLGRPASETEPWYQFW
jgi:outer membrane protein assembly factor BamD